MAFATQNAPLSAGAFAQITGIFADISDRTSKFRLYRRTLNELRELSTADLRDLGLASSTLKTAAYQAVYG